ncbi:HPr family phosphocarrier protein [Marinactinospora thermotolerans]|uniref:Phosphocarrier protein HPr n=1 Tax=Marinactinospora thermotolerans DSM 45154 TaxID=1122192 RepID=A0A1T4QIL8_9ACTN|nr:HPr family phosphocarrier protein [Marinactinospora thermotolerans]SKA03643.1 Phosphocarrier protein HPr [Marinactinospora thermotolerans DSM 45154]
MAERRVKVESEVGLHARPAALFVGAAAKAGGDVTVAKGDGSPVSAKSILAVMSLDVRHGDEIVINAESEELLDELAAIANAG